MEIQSLFSIGPRSQRRPKLGQILPSLKHTHTLSLFISQSFPLPGTDVVRVSFLRATETNANLARANSPTTFYRTYT